MLVLAWMLMWTVCVALPYALVALALGRWADVVALAGLYLALGAAASSTTPPRPVGAEDDDAEGADTTTIRTVALAKSVHTRARVTRDLASSVAFCESYLFNLVPHAQMIHITPRGVVIDIGNAPDPPEGGYSSYSPSWSIGCVLHKMIMGAPPVSLLDARARPVLGRADALRLACARHTGNGP